MKKAIILLMLVIAPGLIACRADRDVPSETPTPSQSAVITPEQEDWGIAEICRSVSEIPVSECVALVAFYDNSGGPHWVIKRGWLETTQPCAWYGVHCIAGHVTAITMNYNDLRGSLPPELGDLTALETLSLYFNYLEGELPPEIGRLAGLQTLILHNNRLSGSLPAEWGGLTSLRLLDLDSNELSGSLPAELGRLTRLETLKLNDNKLSGSIPPELGQLSNLTGLFLAGNDLTGPIPAELGHLSGLQMVDLRYNELTGSLPENLAALPVSGYDYLAPNQD